MSKQRKPKSDPTATPVEDAPAATAQVSPPSGRPPGRILTGGHGPQTCVRVLDGPTRLRQVLNLSATYDINQACEDAAVEIERLRRQGPQPPRPWTKDRVGPGQYV